MVETRHKTSRLLVPPVKRAFPFAGHALPEDVTPFQSEYTFRRQLKKWLFKKTFPDTII